MKKKDLVKFVANVANVTKKDSAMVVDAVLEGLRNGLVEDGNVSITGFGTFLVKDKPAHKARNPQTGETVDVPEKRVLKFKASKDLKESIQ